VVAGGRLDHFLLAAVVKAVADGERRNESRIMLIRDPSPREWSDFLLAEKTADRSDRSIEMTSLAAMRHFASFSRGNADAARTWSENCTTAIELEPARFSSSLDLNP